MIRGTKSHFSTAPGSISARSHPPPDLYSRRAASGTPAETGRPEWRGGVAGGHGAGRVAQGDYAAQRIHEKMACPVRVRPRQILVNAEPGEEIGHDRRGIQLLHRCQAIVEKAALVGDYLEAAQDMPSEQGQSKGSFAG